MKSKERFLAVCNHGSPDGVLVDYLAHKKTDERLKEYFNITTEEELLDKLGCDFYYLPGRDISQNEGFMKFYKGPALDICETERICPFGIRWHRGAYDHKFNVDEAIRGPLENAETEKDILDHKWPKASDFDFSPLHDECDAHSGRVIIGGLWTGIMGDSYRMHGFQNFLLNMAVKPELVKTLVNKVTEVYLELNNAVFGELKGKLDVWFFGNDFGSQNGLLVSPDMWCEFFFENIKSLTRLAHSYGIKVMMHSCGAVSEIIPYLIEAGVDILDPVQVTAKGMKPELLSEKFGGRVIFHGGVDTQQILPCETPENVFAHAANIISLFGSKGGYIFAPSQLLGPDIPVENIIAMYKAVNPELK